MVYVICVVMLFCCLLSIGLFCERTTKIEAKSDEGFPQYPVDGYIHKTNDSMYMYNKKTNSWICLLRQYNDIKKFNNPVDELNYKNKIMSNKNV